MRLLGFEVTDIGTHSIRKGAISYLASLPGGPPIAAVCIRGDGQWETSGTYT